MLRLLGVSNDLRLGSPVVKHAGKDSTNNCVNEVPKMSFLPYWLFFLTFSLNHVFLLGKSLCSQIFGMVISRDPKSKVN